MKILAVGAGSMGRRRLRDLLALEAGEVVLYEPQADRCYEIAARFGLRGFTDFEKALAEKPDAMTVSTPPALHDRYVQKAVDLRIHVFAEVPFVLDPEVLGAITARADDYPSVLGVSHTMRYYPPVRIIHDRILSGHIGKPLYLEYSLGNYLPDWHPYEDYRRFYASDVSLGGAGMDMLLHELNAIQWWMGGVRRVSARLTKLSSLEIEGPDNHDIMLDFENGGRGFFHHDVIEQGTVGRHIRVIGEEGTIEWHQNLPSVRLYQGSTKLSRELGFDQAADWLAALKASREMTEILARQQPQSGRLPSASALSFTYESCYLREMCHFLDAVRGEHPYSMATLSEEATTIRVFHAIMRSNEQKCEVNV